MQNNEQSRQAAGSKNHRHQQYSNAASASRLQSPNGRPPLSPYGFESDEPQTNTRESSQQSQTSSRRMSTRSSTQQQSDCPDEDTAANTEAQLSSKTSTDIVNEWDVVDYSEVTAESYTFPGTWPAALQDTTSALTQVGSATASYASALSHSGISKAGWSVSTALASTANKSALSFVGWATDRTGTGADQLPRPVGKWLEKGKERAWAKRERGLEGVVLETAEMDGTGEIVGPMRVVYKGMATKEEEEEEEEEKEEDEWEVAATEGGIGEKRKEDERGGDEGKDDGGQEDDGMMRLFQYDD